MWNNMLLVGSSLVSGLVGVLVGIFVNRKFEIHREKVEVLKSLITYRYCPCQPERVTSLNIIPIVFSKDEKVCALFEDYKRAHDAVTENISNPNGLSKLEALDESYIKLIESIAKNLKFDANLSWDKLKHPYIPKSYLDMNGNQQWY